MWTRYVGRTATLGASTFILWIGEIDTVVALIGMLLLAVLWIVNDGPADRTTNACRLLESARAKPLAGSRTPLPATPIPVPSVPLSDLSQPDSKPVVTPELPAPRLTSTG